MIVKNQLWKDAHELWLESRHHLLKTSIPFMILDKFTESFLAPIADAVIPVTPGRADVMREMVSDPLVGEIQ